MAKLKIDQIVNGMKEGLKEAKTEAKKAPAQTPQVKPGGVRVRDMRQEARELGSHGAEDMFGKDQTNGPV